MTALSELTFGEVSHDNSDETGIREWALRGPDGVVNFLAKGTTGLVIGFHVPATGEPGDVACDLLDLGWCREDFTFLGAAELEDRWLAAGGDETVIRGALESWYASHLAPGGELT